MGRRMGRHVHPLSIAGKRGLVPLKHWKGGLAGGAGPHKTYGDVWPLTETRAIFWLRISNRMT